jgi:hypothetical protein
VIGDGLAHHRARVVAPRVSVAGASIAVASKIAISARRARAHRSRRWRCAAWDLVAQRLTASVIACSGPRRSCETTEDGVAPATVAAASDRAIGLVTDPDRDGSARDRARRRSFFMKVGRGAPVSSSSSSLLFVINRRRVIVVARRQRHRCHRPVRSLCVGCSQPSCSDNARAGLAS